MTLSDLISIGMTFGTGIIIFANIILINLIAYYRDEKDSLGLFGLAFIIFGITWVIYMARVFDFFVLPIPLAGACFYAALIAYYVATSKLFKHSINYYLISALIIAYCIIHWSPGASDSMSLRSLSQPFVSGALYSCFAYVYYRQFRLSKNLGHLICCSAHTLIIVAEITRFYLLLELVEPIMVLGLIVVAHTIALILNNVGIMTGFSFAHYKTVRNLSKQDSLTGLLNRRGFFNLYQSKSPQHTNVAVISCDIDFFKAINDKHGHHYGDQVLEQVAHKLKQHTKEHFDQESLVARWGGEEFIIALFDCPLAQAKHLANALREATHNQSYQVENKSFKLSLSFGVAQQTIDTSTIESIINASDQALYHAKTHGRNRVACTFELDKDSTTSTSKSTQAVT